MGLVTPETVKAFTEGAESIVKVTAGVSTDLMNEAINLFIIDSLLSVMKFAVVFVIFFVVKKSLDTAAEAYKEKEGMLKMLKTTALVLSLIFFTTQSFPHIQEISKAMVAPKIFLMQKGVEIVRGVK